MRSRLAVLVAVLACLAVPASAQASPSQFTIMQDDATLLGTSGRDPEAAMAEARQLGVDVIRVFLGWFHVSPANQSRTRPAGFDVGDPNSLGYDWTRYDALVDRARRHGFKVLFTIGPAIPFWASEQPSRCPHRIGGYANLEKSCMWKPQPKLFGQFVKAVALRYGSYAPPPNGGQVAFYSLWNEPNLEHYLYPQFKRTRHGIVDLGGAYYRKLWWEGWKSINTYDSPLRGKVLFGETSAISSPMDTLYAALCLDPDGKPFKRSLRRLQGCNNARRLPIGGIAVHPYNHEAVGSVYQRSHTKDSLPLPHLGRLTKLMNRASARRRIPRGRGIYITEFGFQSDPPDRGTGLSLSRHAAAINEADRLFYADPRVKALAQYELYDVENPDDFNTGLRRFTGPLKPAWYAFRMPLVVTKLSADRVEVWGQVRPAVGPTRVQVRARNSSSGEWALTAPIANPSTNARGYFRVRISGRGIARRLFRTRWTNPADGEVIESRVARAGKPIKYLEDPVPRARRQRPPTGDR